MSFVNVLGVLFSIATVILTFFFTFVPKWKRKKPQSLSGVDVLQILKVNKPFPVSCSSGWRLVNLQDDKRVWECELTSDLLTSDPLTCQACFSKVKGSAQNVLLAIKDISKMPEWVPGLHSVKYVTMNNADGDMKNSTQFDVISVETDDNTNRMIGLVNTVSQKYQGEPLLRKVNVIHRYWHREDGGSCWLLEACEEAHTWTFYLAQPVEEIDQCLLTVVTFTPDDFHHNGNSLPALRLGALQDFLVYRKLQCTPLSTISLPSAAGGVEEETNVESQQEAPIKDKVNDEHVVKDKINKEQAKENNIIKRFKNMIDEKKEWYEERKKKNSSPPALIQSPKGEKATSIVNKVEKSDATNVEPEKGDIESNEDIVKIENVDDSQEGETETADNNMATSDLTLNLDKLESNPRCKIQKSSSLGTAEEMQSGDSFKANSGDKSSKSQGEPEPKNNKEEIVGAMARFKKNLLRKVKSLEIPDKAPSIKDKEINGTEETLFQGQMMEAEFKKIANQAAMEILEEKTKVSCIDIGSSYDQQSVSTGGWIYCGLEKDVVILRKLFAEGIPLQCYLGKGLIPVAPKVVFETLKNPAARYTYDEMLKKIDVIHEFENGLKIVHLYHEVSQLFRKEARDFCVLQSERIEGVKYIISLRSVSWSGCPDNPNVVRGKFLPSGWIIEPVTRDNKLFSMVTYIVQMELGMGKTNSGYMIEELAAKQPLGVAHLRQYLAISPGAGQITQYSPISPPGGTMPPRPPGGSTLAAVAAASSKGSRNSNT